MFQRRVMQDSEKELLRSAILTAKAEGVALAKLARYIEDRCSKEAWDAEDVVEATALLYSNLSSIVSDLHSRQQKLNDDKNHFD